MNTSPADSSDPTPSETSPAPSGAGGNLSRFLRSELTGGALALLAAGIALMWANLLPESYAHTRSFQLGPLSLEHWASDGLLTVFFFVVGLELAQEFTTGALRRPQAAAVPVIAAVAGVIAPAGIYLMINLRGGHPHGWAISSATDIAFALAVLAIAGRALPGQLRVFLLTLAIVDDFIVIIIIAVFYADAFHWMPLLGAIGLLGIYGVAQRTSFTSPWVYALLGLAAWWLLYNSGVHATIAGATAGLLTRVRPVWGESTGPSPRWSQALSPMSSIVVVPLFALMSAGVFLDAEAISQLLHSRVALGVAAGLIIGKPLGVLGITWLMTHLTPARLAPQVTWSDFFGVGLLCGIGFTVSLLVSDLAFADTHREEAKAAVLFGSLISAILGWGWLRIRNAHHRRRATSR